MPASLPYHVYLDLDVINNDFSSSPPPLLKFEETRNAPFLDGSSSDYFVLLYVSQYKLRTHYLYSFLK